MGGWRIASKRGSMVCSQAVCPSIQFPVPKSPGVFEPAQSIWSGVKPPDRDRYVRVSFQNLISTAEIATHLETWSQKEKAYHPDIIYMNAGAWSIPGHPPYGQACSSSAIEKAMPKFPEARFIWGTLQDKEKSACDNILAPKRNNVPLCNT